MSTLTVNDVSVAREFLETVEVQGQSSAFEGVTDSSLPAPDFGTNKSQVVAVGSQIAEFAENVPDTLRPQIANSFLLAQLAANRTVANDGGSQVWYDRYVEVLANVGWLVESDSLSVRDVSGSALKVHKEIIPVVATLFGPAVASAALITTVLNGLNAMDEDAPWITLFDRESQRANANQFQVSYADVSESAGPRISVASFELNASKSVTRVLFFKFSKAKATLRYCGSKLSMNAGVFSQVTEVVENRVADFVTNYIADIEI